MGKVSRSLQRYTCTWDMFTQEKIVNNFRFKYESSVFRYRIFIIPFFHYWLLYHSRVIDIMVSRTATFEEILHLVGHKLGIRAKRLFTSEGT